MRLGWPWVEGRTDDPWDVEAEVGELEFAEPGERPANVVALEDVPLDEDGDKVLAAAAGSERSGLNWIRRTVGKRGCPPHCHSLESEAFVVLEGSGTLELLPVRGGEPERHELRPGHVFARPPGSRVAHSIVAGADGVTYLAYGTREPERHRLLPPLEQGLLPRRGPDDAARAPRVRRRRAGRLLTHSSAGHGRFA